MRLIATEEAWSIPEVAAELKKVANGPSRSFRSTSSSAA